MSVLCSIFGHNFRLLQVKQMRTINWRGAKIWPNHWDWECRRCGLIRLNGRLGYERIELIPGKGPLADDLHKRSKQ